MDRQTFEQHLEGIQAAIFSGIKTYLEEEGIPYKQIQLQEQGSTDLDQLCREVLFLGCDEFLN